MASYMKNTAKRPLGTSKAFTCLWLVMLVVLSSEKMASHGCEKQNSTTWDGTPCIRRGKCNKPCRAEGFDNGHCDNLFTCICYRNCTNLSFSHMYMPLHA
ncbi:hypothetical protein CFC21_089557 [Triticum aestivum]|uniref:Knottins-like domain-containing protein n=2 Tax=Triticum aestivum TaxID=4565 RepID=A0A3B6PRP2_WHEAT|nr:hypothetical protein CFC21_089557 [Triticum aestivum]